MPIGWSRGFAKRQGTFIYHGQPKEVYVYVLEQPMRQRVHEDLSQPLLTREFLLAQRLWEEQQTQPKRKRMKVTQESWTAKLPSALNLSQSDLACVGQELCEFTGLFRETFRRIESFELCELYLQGLLSETRRKNVEAMALKLKGPPEVRNLQRFVGEYKWEDDWLAQQHWKLCAQALDHEQGVWSIDASEFAKKGNDSVGVAPQYCGALGKKANCQSGVFVCYSSPKGHALLESRLYLPLCWFQEDYAQRRQKCCIPDDVEFQTKPQLALELLRPLWESGLFRGNWVTMDCSFGNNPALLDQLPQGCNYLAEIPCTRKVWVKKSSNHPELQSQGCTVEALLEAKDLLQWSSHKVAEGEKGPIVAAFARIRVYLSADRSPESERWLLLRNGPDRKIKYALSNAPQQTTLKRMIQVSAARWPIERCFQEDKSELGLDHYEHRSWKAWHRHMRLVFLAQLFLLRLRLKYKKSPGTDLTPSSPTIGVVPSPSGLGTGLRHQSSALLPTAQLPSLQISSQTPY
jgi:SRSO17 transposase